MSALASSMQSLWGSSVSCTHSIRVWKASLLSCVWNYRRGRSWFCSTFHFPSVCFTNGYEDESLFTSLVSDCRQSSQPSRLTKTSEPPIFLMVPIPCTQKSISFSASLFCSLDIYCCPSSSSSCISSLLSRASYSCGLTFSLVVFCM